MATNDSRRPTPRQKPTKRVKTGSQKVTRAKAPAPAPRAAKAPASQPLAKASRPAKSKPAKASKAARAAKPAKPSKPAKSVISARPSVPRPTARKAKVPTPTPGGRQKAPTLDSRPAGGGGPLGALAGAAAGVGGLVGSVVGSRSKSGPAASGREARQRHQSAQTGLLVARVAAGALVLAVLLGVAYLLLRNSSAFVITSVEAEPTAHVTQEDIQNLVQVPEGSTLLNVDTAAIEEALKKDPWVASVDFERVFPNTLRIHINEQGIEALVVMSTGTLAWYLGDAGVWIQPTKVTAADGQSVNDAALQIATADGCLLITDVPSTVDPVAGSVATDEVLASVELFREGFSSEFSSQIVSYSAPSTDNITCVLSSGVEISLGSATDISTKEQIATEILEAHPGQVTYINVRNPTRTGSSYRKISSDNVQSGSGLE